MKQVKIAIRAAALIPAAALLATPAFAQEATTASPVVQPAPAPVPQTAEPAASPQAAAPALQAETPLPQAETPVPQAVTPPPVVSTTPPAEATPAEPVAAEETAAPQARTRAARPAPRAVARAVAPETPALVAPADAPVAAAPAASTPVEAPPSAPVAAVSAPDAGRAVTTTETAAETSSPTWPWIAGAIALIAVIGAFFALRRRREDEEVYYEEVAAEPAYAEPAYVEPTYVAPAAAPIVAAHAYNESVEDQAELVAPDAEEVAAITASDAPAGRPWIELSFRPVRAGATEDSATVDVELTLGNAGDVAAKNVRVSTFMLGDRSDAPTEMERLLATDHAGTEVDAGRIEPGEGSRVDATLSVPRDGMTARSYSPVVVADVRYDLPDGSEGRTAASFVVGATTDTEALSPLDAGDDTREDVGAALHGELERA